jgi:hypothetical protein
MTRRAEGRVIRCRRKTLVALLLGFLLFGPGAISASAELIYFGNGRTLSVKGYRVDGDSLVLFLRGGGEVVCSLSVIDRIEPDEISHPGDAAPAAPATALMEPPPAYAGLIDALAAAEGVDPKLVRAVIQVESRYRPKALSPKGAMGLMQLMPGTAREYAVRDPYDPRDNLRAGIRHLKSLLDRFDLSLALAAYNAGEAAVTRYGGVPPYPETRSYVAQVLSLAGPVR